MGSVDAWLAVDQHPVAVENYQLETAGKHANHWMHILMDGASRSIHRPSSLVPGGGRRAHPDFLRQLLRHPKQRLAAIHFGPDLGGGDPEFAPQHDKIVEEVDALMDNSRPVPTYGFDDDFRRFLG